MLNFPKSLSSVSSQTLDVLLYFSAWNPWPPASVSLKLSLALMPGPALLQLPLWGSSQAAIPGWALSQSTWKLFFWAEHSCQNIATKIHSFPEKKRGEVDYFLLTSLHHVRERMEQGLRTTPQHFLPFWVGVILYCTFSWWLQIPDWFPELPQSCSSQSVLVSMTEWGPGTS